MDSRTANRLNKNFSALNGSMIYMEKIVNELINGLFEVLEPEQAEKLDGRLKKFIEDNSPESEYEKFMEAIKDI